MSDEWHSCGVFGEATSGKCIQGNVCKDVKKKKKKKEEEANAEKKEDQYRVGKDNRKDG